ncbi:hypothetical protein TrRE_jg9440, partial [Triparma retinervis]
MFISKGERHSNLPAQTALMIFGRLLFALCALWVLPQSLAKKGKGGGAGDICNFDPANPTNPLSSPFNAAYCYDPGTCNEDRCDSCGVEESQRYKYYCTPPQELDTITSVPGFFPDKKLARCTQCCSGKVSSITLGVTAPGTYSIDGHEFPDAWFVNCANLERLLVTGESGLDAGPISKEVDVGEDAVGVDGKLCIAPVQNIKNGLKNADFNIDACDGGPSDGLKAVFNSNDVLIESSVFPEDPLTGR